MSANIDGNLVKSFSNSNAITEVQWSIFRNAERGTKILFDSIKVGGSKGTVIEIEPVVIQLY